MSPGGPSGAGARRRGRCRPGLLAVALVWALLLVATLGAPPASGWPPDRFTLATAPVLARASAAQAEPVATLAVTLASIEPKAPKPGERVVATGEIANLTASPVAELSASLRIWPEPLHSRDELAQFAADPAAPFPSDPLTGPEDAQVQDRLLAPGARSRFSIQVPARQLSGLDFGVYRVAIEVAGSGEGGFGPLAWLRTFLPWAPTDSSYRPSRIAWLWPLVDRPHQGGGSAWRDDDLAPQLQRGGRLDTLVRVVPPAAAGTARAGAPKPVPVTWTVDPLLLADVDDMTDGYEVQPPGSGRARAGAGREAAIEWRSALRAAARYGTVAALPYADPDVVALTRGGLAADFRRSVAIGAPSVRDDLGVPVTRLAWAPGGYFDEATLAGTGPAETRVSSSGAVPTSVDPGYTPGAHVQVPATPGGTGPQVVTDVLVADAVLSDAVSAGAADPAAARLAEQRFLAETLMITAERPNAPREILVAPERRWTPSPGYAAALLADTARVGWLDPIPLAAIATAADSGLPRAPLAYPRSAQQAELSADYVAAVGRSRTVWQGLAEVVPTGQGMIRQLDLALLRTQSSAGRERPAEAEALRSGVAVAVDEARGRVRVASAPGSLVTLTSRSGTVPVTLANDLDAPVLVLLELDAGPRLSIAGTLPMAQRVPPHRQVQVEFQAQAHTAGVFPLVATLRTPAGAPFGPAVQIYVRSTEYGTLALAITGVATIVLFGAVTVRLIRRALRARRPREPTR